MSYPNLAARDPLFWVHHANVDRLWMEWLRKKEGRANPSETDLVGKFWYQPQFEFYDENKKKVRMSAKDVIETTKLEYIYDMYPDFRTTEVAVEEGAQMMAPEVEGQPAKSVAESSESSLKLGGKPLRILLKTSAQGRADVESVAKGEKGSAKLTIRGVRIAGNRGSMIRVYLNLPENATPPGVKDPHYAGSISFFRHEHDDMGVTASLSVTDALRDLQKQGLLKEGELSVTLVQRKPSERKESLPELRFEKVTIEIAMP
jgi:Protein of unknown function (DUF_B2219)/Common central domain of tyrosinase/Polyphenol oxidase middle domain